MAKCSPSKPRRPETSMKELDIKRALGERFAQSGEVPPLLEELELSGGKVRADLVDVSAMHCYEIKSHGDSLTRLLSQGVRYNWVFDRITLVTAEKHLKKALELLPEWWGVLVVHHDDDVLLHEFRPAQLNHSYDGLQLARILKRNECLCYLEEANLLNGRKSKNLTDLQSFIADTFEVDELKNLVKRCLVARAQSAVA